MNLTIRVTASCMRTITKCGGLDQYLLGDKPARIKEFGLFGWKLRWKVMNSKKFKKKFAAERKKLGLEASASEVESFDEAYRREQDELLEEKKKQWQALREKDERFVEHVRSKWEPKGTQDWSKRLEKVVPPEFGKLYFTELERRPKEASPVASS